LSHLCMANACSYPVAVAANQFRWRPRRSSAFSCQQPAFRYMVASCPQSFARSRCRRHHPSSRFTIRPTPKAQLFRMSFVGSPTRSGNTQSITVQGVGGGRLLGVVSETGRNLACERWGGAGGAVPRLCSAAPVARMPWQRFSGWGRACAVWGCQQLVMSAFFLSLSSPGEPVLFQACWQHESAR